MDKKRKQKSTVILESAVEHLSDSLLGNDKLMNDLIYELSAQGHKNISTDEIQMIISFIKSDMYSGQILGFKQK